MEQVDIDRLSPEQKSKIIDETRIKLKKYRDLIDDYEDGLRRAKEGEAWALDSLKKLGAPE